jgi:hypothetical protein
MTSLRIRKAVATVAAVASGLVPMAHAAPAFGAPPVPAPLEQCTVVAGPRGEDVQQLAVTLHAVHPAAAVVVAGCGIVTREGVVAYAHAYGVVAVDAVQKTIHEGSYSICTDLRVIYIDGSEISDMNCPR